MQEKQMKKNKNQKGITLITLVVTIIVMIILAGISIISLTGDNGIIKQSKDAKERAEIAQENEIVNLAVTRAMEKDKYGNVTKEYLKEALDDLIGNGKYNLSENEVFIITFLETQRSYRVDLNGNLIESGEIGESSEDNYIPTNPDYFTYELNEETKTATLTGIKDEYMLKSYYYDYNFNIYCPIAIIDGDNKITDVKIPNKVIKDGNTYTVTSIAGLAFGINGLSYFDRESEFTSFYIPDTINSIGQDAFRRVH